VHLQYSISNRIRELLTTSAHPKLVDMVNAAKREITGLEGGAFYINEFKQVIVPTPQGYLYAGEYHKELRFDFDGTTIGPSAPDGLRPGDEWKGPHVGIPYVLTAACDDVYYKQHPTPKREVRVHLSDDVGAAAATKLAKRLAKVKGTGGGRIYINEECEFFAPINDSSGLRYEYLGHLDNDSWFSQWEMPGDAP